MEQNALLTLALLVAAWAAFYIAAVLLGLQRYGLEIHPYYALYKSTRLNTLLERLGRSSPRLWRVLGNIGVAASLGQVVYMTYLLFINLHRFLYLPERASPVMPLIPGVTIRLESLPWFLAAAGLVILTHELAHGVQCAVEGVPIRSSAILLAVITFGGAVEPDEKSLEAAGRLQKMRIFAAGSATNLATGLALILIFVTLGDRLPYAAYVFLQWLYFLSVNLALVNMLPIYPLDGGQMFKTLVDPIDGHGILQRAAMYGFLAIIGLNLTLSLARFGLIPF